MYFNYLLFIFINSSIPPPDPWLTRSTSTCTASQMRGPELSRSSTTRPAPASASSSSSVIRSNWSLVAM